MAETNPAGAGVPVSDHPRPYDANGPSAEPIASAHRLTSLIRDHADETEAGRRLAQPVTDALRSAGLFTMGLPASLGGPETPLATALTAIEQIAYADGATGWNIMIAFDSGVWTGFIHTPQARALVASIPQPVMAGVIYPPGTLESAPGGYRLTGRWRFASGCQQAHLFIVGAFAVGGEGNGTPRLFQVLLPADSVTIIDTWHVGGLRGTGSHDLAVENLFVEQNLVQPMEITNPTETGPLYRFGLFPIFGLAKAAVALGIARHATEEFEQLAQGKTPAATTSLLRDRVTIQADVARAEVSIRSARALINEVVAELWDIVAKGGVPTSKQRAWARLAAVDGVHRAVDAVGLMYRAGSGTAIYESSPLERCFRDVNIIPAHVVVQPNVYEIAGRVLLGLDPATPLF